MGRDDEPCRAIGPSDNGEWRLHDGFAARTGLARADDPLHLEASWHIFQLFGHILAQSTQGSTAPTAIIARRQFFVFPIQMIRQRLAAVLALRLPGILCRGWRVGLRLCRLDDLGVLLQVETELVETFGFAAKAMAVGTMKLVLKLLDFEAQSLDLIGQKAVHRPQLGGVFRGDIEIFQHPHSIPLQGSNVNP
jgi:hypothetical protein